MSVRVLHQRYAHFYNRWRLQLVDGSLRENLKID